MTKLPKNQKLHHSVHCRRYADPHRSYNELCRRLQRMVTSTMIFSSFCATYDKWRYARLSLIETNRKSTAIESVELMPIPTVTPWDVTPSPRYYRECGLHYRGFDAVFPPSPSPCGSLDDSTIINIVVAVTIDYYHVDDLLKDETKLDAEGVGLVNNWTFQPVLLLYSTVSTVQ